MACPQVSGRLARDCKRLIRSGPPLAKGYLQLQKSAQQLHRQAPILQALRWSFGTAAFARPKPEFPQKYAVTLPDQNFCAPCPQAKRLVDRQNYNVIEPSYNVSETGRNG
jgi:hypothetical protein